MFYYVRDLFKRFILKLRTVNVNFHVLPYSGQQMTQKVCGKFDRIETTTLADGDLVGIRAVVDTLSPLLKAPWINPDTAMITLHPGVFDKIRNTFPCPECDPDRAERIKQAVDLTTEGNALLDAYVPLRDADPVNWIFATSGWQRRDARWLFRDPSAAAWELYKDILRLPGRRGRGHGDDAKHSQGGGRMGPSRLKQRRLARQARTPDAGGQMGLRLPLCRAAEPRDAARGKNLARKQTADMRAGREPKRHKKYHERLSDEDLAGLQKKGSRRKTVDGE
ncbi:hypothetical protein F5B21DRAFT_524211 [Xylaria acuta]|nr:hypothetical protein F5B21DRAFT_524211 [Xylaria acuta]